MHLCIFLNVSGGPAKQELLIAPVFFFLIAEKSRIYMKLCDRSSLLISFEFIR